MRTQTPETGRLSEITPPNSPKPPEQVLRPVTGMTLLEVLVVIAIMAILLGLVNLGFQSGGQRQALISGEKLAAQINHASLLATLRGTPMALALADQGYQFMQHRPEGQDSGPTHRWVIANQRGLGKTNPLPHPGKLYLELDSAPLTLTSKMPDTPQLLFSPSGELPDFTISIVSDNTDSGYTVSAGPERFQASVMTNADGQ